MNKNEIVLEKATSSVIAVKQHEVVIIDDDTEICDLLSEFYNDAGPTITFQNALGALEYLKTKGGNVGLIVCDLRLPDISGISFLEKIKETSVQAPVLLITAHASKQSALNAIHKGAFDYITKPLDFNELKIVSDRAVKFYQLETDYQNLQKQITDQFSLDGLVGKSPEMQRLFELITKVASSPANVLITGESGSGKEMVARAIHNLSERKPHKFVAVNCSAIPASLLESELFGHKRGSFTGAQEDRKGLFQEADGGTLFLDEIGDMPVELQSKLLRVLQERRVRSIGSNKDVPIDVKVISATHKDLKMLIDENEFREDLYYRLCVIPIHVPALRDRKEDIPLLTEVFYKKYRTYNPRVRGLAKETVDKLIRLKWTGNVRELENAIERAITLSSGPEILPSDIVTELDSDTDRHLSSLFTKLPSLRQIEKEYIQYVLYKMDNRKEEAAKVLGINRKTLYRKEKEFNL